MRAATRVEVGLDGSGATVVRRMRCEVPLLVRIDGVTTDVLDPHVWPPVMPAPAHEGPRLVGVGTEAVGQKTVWLNHGQPPPRGP